VSNLATEKFFESPDTIQGWSIRHTSFDARIVYLLGFHVTKNKKKKEMFAHTQMTWY
jgi:hypothetical protein